MNKLMIPVKHNEQGNSAWVAIEDLKLFTEQVSELQKVIDIQNNSNKSLLKEIKRLKFLNERYIQAGKVEYLNVIVDTDCKHIKQIDKISTVIVDQIIPVDLDNGCYYVDNNGRIVLNKQKLIENMEVY